MQRAAVQEGVLHIVLTLGSAGAAWCCFARSLKPFAMRPPQRSPSSQCGRSQTTTQACHRDTVVALHLPALPATIRSLIGAGDSLVAGCVDALLRGLGPGQALAFGVVSSSNQPQSQTWSLRIAYSSIFGGLQSGAFASLLVLIRILKMASAFKQLMQFHFRHHSTSFPHHSTFQCSSSTVVSLNLPS